MTIATRPAARADLPRLARIWHDGWQEAHAAHVPTALHRLRSLRSFETRLAGVLSDTVTAGPAAAPLGLCITRDDELYQLYVDPSARGTGLASALIAAGEERMRSAGHATAHLYAIPQNARALAFYRKCGWTIGPVEDVEIDTLEGPFPLACVVLTKWL